MHYLSFVWDPAEGIDLGFFMIRYYSLMFVIAFTLGWFITKRIYKNEGESQEKLDSLFIYMVIATLLGARLGHVIFYQPELITEDPLSILLPIRTVPEFEFTGFQGLASHGAAISIIIAMFIYAKRVIKKPVLWVLDRIVIAVTCGGIFIRLGNFINSEIIGKPTGSDYGVIFAQLNETFPRHPAQLYESAGCVILFILLYYIYWKTEKSKQLGFIFGVFLVILWSIRFFVEFVKEAQVVGREDWYLNTGQLLSIPLVLAGFYFIWRSYNNRYEA
ncbi:prolipoprotein diacylglyceryl transferase [Constantimarinum furrinae]|uniref:Phosphatidylglycerol--prolipoprotein diacylglyceryl transferase n=1 Tax=Constantimarinum furrinae TaxID=2562285 RepID=A0A7G8PUU8_9FLAO|nr:prolipoprotein diacylglyceryl transferase [Constantimarinum furrinae]QNJ98114.1 Prolipoprotein diacylglyceryl transferase [Constantimarinum furrinae]